MVERPIKKSERQVKDVAGEGTEQTSSGSEERRERPRSQERGNKERGKGRGGKGRDRGEAVDKPPANPALMRGPRPTKPKPGVEEAPVEESTEATEAETADTEATEMAEAATEA